MKKKTVVIGSVLAFALVGAIVLLYGNKLISKKNPPRSTITLTDPITTAPVGHKDFYETSRWFGTVKAETRVRLVPLESGRIVSVHFRHERAVKKGTILFTLGGPLIDRPLARLRTQRKMLRKRLTLAERVVRTKEVAVSRKFAKQEDLLFARDRLAHLRTQESAAKEELKRMEEGRFVRSPVDGIITGRRVSTGQNVERGEELADIVSANHVYVASTLFTEKDVKLESKDALINRPGKKPIPGKVVNVLPERTAEGGIVALIEGPALDRVLKPGERVNGRIVLSAHVGMLALPRGAVVRDGEERAYVFLRELTGYRKKAVKTGIVSDGWVEITSGLKEGDEVVVRGAYELFYRDFNKKYKVAD